MESVCRTNNVVEWGSQGFFQLQSLTDVKIDNATKKAYEPPSQFIKPTEALAARFREMPPISLLKNMGNDFQKEK
ncbi:hypothetical protein HZS_4937 [Henneguya salminicola]|nr:hypothetical protein HZS_4937 [Henneguya salminicola]